MEACNGSHARIEVRNGSVLYMKELRPRYARTCVYTCIKKYIYILTVVILINIKATLKVKVSLCNL